MARVFVIDDTLEMRRGRASTAVGDPPGSKIVPPAEDSEAWARLMEDDTFVAGVMASVLDPGQHLQPDQRDILNRCLGELDALLPRLDGPARDYAGRLREITVQALVL